MDLLLSTQEWYLVLHLLRGHKKRRKQCCYWTRGLISRRVSIHDRPASVAGRRRFGHWESNSVEGEKWSSCLCGTILIHNQRLASTTSYRQAAPR